MQIQLLNREENHGLDYLREKIYLQLWRSLPEYDMVSTGSHIFE